MLIVVAIIFLLWTFGFINIPWLVVPKVTAFYLLDRPVAIWDLLVMAAMICLALSLPKPFREILWAVTVLWLLSVLGVIAFANSAYILFVGVALGLIISFFHKPHAK